MKKGLLLLLLLSVIGVTAQKKTLGISKFDRARGINDTYVKAIQTKVIETFQNTNRFDIVDRTSYSKIQEEKELQKSEEFMDGKVTAQSTMQGADAIISGLVNSVSFSVMSMEHSDGTISSYIDCKINFSLKVIDVATGEVIASKVLTPSRGFFGDVLSKSMGGPQTKDAAFYKSLKGLQKSIDKFVAKEFPVTTQIIEITKTSSSSAKELLLNTGEMNGSKKGQIFYVYELTKVTVSDKKIIRKKEIGKVKIIVIEGEEISKAKVIKGGDAILAKFNSGSKIVCYSKN